MFKKIVTACAAAALGAGLFAPTITFAVTPNPLMAQPANTNAAAATVFSSVDPNVPITVELVRQNSMIAGTIKVQGQTFPFVAREQNGYFDGYWEYNGQRVPLQAVIRGNDLGIVTNGAQYLLTSQNATPINNGPINGGPINNGPINAGPIDIGPVNPLGGNGPINAEPVKGGPVHQLGAEPLNGLPATPFKTVHSITGNHFICPVVGGWEHMEDQTNVMVFSPDKKSVYGVSLVPNVAAPDPARFLQDMFKGYGVADLQVLKMRELRTVAEEKAIEAEVTFTGRDGVKRHGKMVASIFTFPNGKMGFFQHAACPEEQWNQVGPALFELTSGIKKVSRPPSREGYDR